MMKFAVLVSVWVIVRSIDVQMQLQYQNTLNYIIELANSSKLQQLQYSHHKKCVSMQCCICGQSFKSQSASAIHFNLHHQQLLKFDSDIAILFDESVPSEQRYQFCEVYLGRIFGDRFSANVRQEVCYVTSWDMYRQQAWIQILKYILYTFLGIVSLVYYTEILKPWR